MGCNEKIPAENVLIKTKDLEGKELQIKKIPAENVLIKTKDLQDKELKINKKNLLHACKVGLRTIILRDNVIRKHWWTIAYFYELNWI